MGTRIKRYAALAVLLSAQTGCLSEKQASPAENPAPDPYAGMDCARKVDAIAKDVLAFSPARMAAPKAAADSVPDSGLVSGTDSADASKAADTTAKPSIITVLKGYPPMTGLNPDSPSGTISINDSRPYEHAPVSGPAPGVQWIPPVDFVPAGGSAATVAPSAQKPEPLPEDISTIQVIVNVAYRAEVGIYDYGDRLIRSFRQEFGFQGELENPNRIVPGHGIVSYLVWDARNAAGEWAPSGTYLWRIRLRFENGSVEDRTVKTGLIGPECRDR